MSEGWIKLHRQIQESKIWNNPVGLKIWLWCLIKANHKECDVLVGRQLVHLNTGQFIFGRFTASEELRQTPSTIRNWIKFLRDDKSLDIKTTNKFSVITILNYKDYQDLDNNLKTNEKQIATDKNVKNVKNIKNIYSSLNSIKQNTLQELSDKYECSLADVERTFTTMKNWCEAKGKVYKNYKAALSNWIIKNIEEGRIKKKTKISENTDFDVPVISEEQRLKNIESIKGLKDKYGLIHKNSQSIKK